MAITGCALTLTACATSQQGPDLKQMQAQYESWLSGVPVPSTDAERSETCRNLRVEAARMQSLNDSTGAMGLNQFQAAEMRTRGNRNIALIQSKMADFRCGG
jgi:hypothetical protein